MKMIYYIFHFSPPHAPIRKKMHFSKKIIVVKTHIFANTKYKHKNKPLQNVFEHRTYIFLKANYSMNTIC